MSAPIYGLQKTTLLDYPGHVACTVFFGYCNFNCPFCHNSSLLLPSQNDVRIPESEVFSHLTKRKGILEGVCITGGEPTLYKELSPFLRKIKELGYKIKLDTNGTNPSLLHTLLEEQLLDYVAMDIKNSPKHYPLSTGSTVAVLPEINKSIELLMTSSISYEFRTTLVKEHHTIQDIKEIGQWLAGDSSYYLQNFRDSKQVLQRNLHSFDYDTLALYLQTVKQYLPNSYLRGED